MASTDFAFALSAAISQFRLPVPNRAGDGRDRKPQQERVRNGEAVKRRLAE